MGLTQKVGKNIRIIKGVKNNEMKIGRKLPNFMLAVQFLTL